MTVTRTVTSAAVDLLLSHDTIYITALSSCLDNLIAWAKCMIIPLHIVTLVKLLMAKLRTISRLSAIHNTTLTTLT